MEELWEAQKLLWGICTPLAHVIPNPSINVRERQDIPWLVKNESLSIILKTLCKTEEKLVDTIHIHDGN